jgi:ABC-type branched-subunit amino acid transport system ATPase component
MSSLQVVDITLRFGEQEILRGVSFSIAAGETVGIIGPNGSGKTTLFNCLSGFVAAQAGQIRLAQREISSASPDARARLGLGRVFQNFGVFREMTVLENMLLALESRLPWYSRLKPGSNSALEAEAHLLLAQVKLQDKAKHKAGSLSGGQLRLLEISRMRAFGASVLLLDEPTAGVSPIMKEEVARVLNELQAEKKTIVVIEHDITFIQKFCRRVIVLDQGRIVLDGSPEQIRASPLLQEIYFGRNEQK